MKRSLLLLCALALVFALVSPVGAQTPFVIYAGDDCIAVDINSADAELLQEIIHIGPARAAQIIELRQQQPFTSFADLARIDGINGEGIRRAEIVAQHEACLDQPAPQPPPQPAPPPPPQPEPPPSQVPEFCEGIPASPFADIAGSVHQANIDCMYAMGVTVGVSVSQYRPRGSVTRAQMATFIANALSRTETGVALPADPDPVFTDVAGVHADNIHALAELGVIQGRTATTFAPNAQVTRAQMATFMAQAYTAATGRTVTPTRDWFDDIAGNVHADNIRVIRELEITAGVTAREYRPREDVRRDQMATFLTNLLAANGQVIPPPTDDDELAVHFLDVGQGDATLLAVDDTAVLVDTGRHDRNDVTSHLARLDVDELDVVAVTHPHADHIGQFPQVMAAVDVAEVWWSGATHTTLTFQRAVEALDASDAAYEEPRAGDATMIGPLEFEFVNPVSVRSDLHDSSLAFRVTYGQVRFLFTGDAEAPTEQRMVTEHADWLAADIYQVGHHGSNTSTTPGFLDAVAPSVAVYSAGAGNQYGHPHAEVIQRLEAADVEVYGTDLHGPVTVTTDGTDWQIVTARSS